MLSPRLFPKRPFSHALSLPRLWRPSSRDRAGSRDSFHSDGQCTSCGELLRDHRQPRRWDRPWQDKPGFFFGNCPCCPSTSSTFGIQTACCANVLPTTLHATFSTPSKGACTPFDGKTVPLTYTTTPRLNYNFSSPRWEFVAVNTSSCQEVVQFFCTLDPAFSACPGFTGCLAYRLNVPAFGSNCAGASGTSSCSCSPLSVVFKNVQFLPPPPTNGCSDCVNGSINPTTWPTVTVTL